MVDLFGKRKYEERIKELESKINELQKEKEELLRNLERRDEKLKKLAGAYQEANIALKTAEQRAVAAQARAEPEAEESRSQGNKLSPREVERLIMRLLTCRSLGEDLITAYLLGSEGLLPDAQRKLGSIRSERGWVLVRYPELFTLALIPPLPIKERSLIEGSTFQLDPLKEILETPVLVVSTHAGDTFLGIALSKDGFEDQKIVRSQVKEKHSKGGWSQRRFERLREEDIKNHAEAVIKSLSEMMGKYGTLAKFAILGGDPSLMKQIAPVVSLQVVERRLGKHDEKKLNQLLDDVYGFTCYRCLD